MNRNEKLLDAIGQIDDSLILDAMEAGNTGKAKVVSIQEGSKRIQGKKKSSRKRAAILRFQGALAACAVLAICLGIYGLLAAEGLLIGPFEKKSSAEMAVERTADMVRAVPEEAATIEAAPAAEEVTVAEAAVSEATETTMEMAVFEAPQEQAVAEEAAEVVIAEAESVEAEPAETEVDTEGADPEEEGVVSEIELALLQEPMVMSLRPAAEEVSGTEVSGEPAEKEEVPLLKVALLETAGTDVTLTYSNDYETATVTYGSMYGLEMQGEDGWTDVPTLENIGWNTMLYILEPGKTSKETHLLSVVYGDLQAGHYRLVKNCTVEHEDREPEEIVIYTEFDIVK